MKTIARNHFMMRHESARLGNVDGNICRDNIEACAALGPPVFTVNVVVDAHKKPVAVTAGHMIEAHRAAVDQARKMTRVEGRRTGIVIAGAAFPEALDLYQLTKIIVPAAGFVGKGGTVIVAGPCPRGIGWGGVINEIIYELLLRRILPRGAKVVMLTDIPKREMVATPFVPASSLDEAMAIARRRNAGARAIRNWAVQRIDSGRTCASYEPLVREETVRAVRAAMVELPVEQRQVVAMRIYEEKTFAEIAEQLDIPLGTALGRMRLALKKLRQRLDGRDL